jgi:ribosomal protein S18 acetylase RimI-like enzyme
MSDRSYPDEVAGPFPSPPDTFTDGDGRAIHVRGADADDFEALVEMYDDFDPADRAQGIPPVAEEAIRDWLDGLLTPESVNVVAEHEGRVVGHAILVPDREEAYELAIFVAHNYQGAGVGTALLKRLLGHGADQGVEGVWLTVERWNQAAAALYRKLGFETSDTESFEMEMSIRLAPESSDDGDESA